MIDTTTTGAHGCSRRRARKRLALLSSVTFLASSLPLTASAQSVLPTGGSVGSGAATIAAPSAANLLITQSSRNAIINWGTFSIGAGNAVRFENGSGATLNRVTGFTPSLINGALSASGSVYLVNPAGITVGPSGTVTTGGSFIASTHDVSDAAFNAGGAMTFSGTSQASVINYGTIGALGGDVALIARKVENAGTITAPNGTVVLAAGYEVLMRDAALSDGKFVVKVGGADTEAKTSGVIKAAEAELKANGGNVYALAGNTGSITKATGVASKGGRVFLTAGDTGSVEVKQKVVARAAPSGGKTKGGEIRVAGGKVKVSGTLDAKGEGDAGGTVVVTGTNIALASSAVIDASGTTGGIVLVGGDYQGGKDASTKFLAESVATAQTVVVDAGAAIHVDGTAGAGGRAVVWSDNVTAFNGTITATGAGTGDGGLVETSGHVLSLGSDVFISTLSERGATGTWLIDPYNVVISSSGSSSVAVYVSGDPWNVQPIGSGAVINNTTLGTYLGFSNVAITTNGAGSEAGNIYVIAPISWANGTSLTLSADGTTGGIVIDGAITGTNQSSSLILSAGAGGIYQTAPISVGTLTANAGNGGSVFLASASNAVSTLGASGAAGSFAFTSGRALTVSGPVTSNGTLSLATTSGDLTINARLADSHASSSLSLSAGGRLLIAKDIVQSGANAALSLSSGSGYALTNGARVSLPDSGASLTINGQAYTLIRGVSALQGLGTSGFYALAGDIDATATASWNGGAGFVPVGTLATPFSGTFAGLGHFIDSLAINRSTTNAVGLFGSTNGAILRDFTLSNVAVAGQARVGAVAGDAFGSAFSNIHVTGSVTALQEAGGIAGWFGQSTMSNVSSAASVTASGADVGGLAGYAYYAFAISDSYATGAASGSARVGGLIGRISSGSPLNLTNVYASGRVTGAGSAGALVGSIDSSSGTFSNIYWDTNSTGQSVAIGSISGSTLGGVGGDVAGGPRTQASYPGLDFTNTWVLIDGETRPMLRSEYSTVIATPAALQLMTLDLSASYMLGANIDMARALAFGSNGYYGGLWGASGFVSVGNDSTRFAGSFDGQGHTITGLTINRGGTNYVGLFGYTSSATIGNVTLAGGSITGNDDVGSLVGYMLGGSVSSASASARVSGSSTSEANTGGLIGAVDGGTVTLSSASGNVTGAGYQVGGLVGYLLNNGTISKSYATGNVTGTSSVAGYGYIGGLVGANGYSGNGGTIFQSYATGTVTGSAGPIGGFVGHNEGDILTSYATGNVVGSGAASNVGGFVGVNYNNGSIATSYSTGYVTGPSVVGGFIGYNNNVAGAILLSYWDVQTSGRANAVGGGTTNTGIAHTTAQLQGTRPVGFSGAIWGTGANLYPYFLWNYATTPVAVSGIAYSDAGTTALAGVTVTAVTGGTALGAAATGANGYYYILGAAGSIASTGVLTYLDNGTAKGAAFSDVIGTNGVQNVAIYGTAAHLITGQPALSATRSDYLAARGSYADTDLSFLSASSFAPLTTTAGYGVYLDAAGNYTLDINLGSGGALALSSGGTFGVSGSRTFSAAGALTLGSPVSWSDTSSLSLTTTGSGNGITLGAVTGTNGTLSLSAAGAVTAPGAVNVGTFILTAGNWSQIAATLPSFGATDFRLSPTASFLRATSGNGAPATPYVITDVYGLQGMASYALAAKAFTLGADIDASGTASWNAGAGFLGIGDNSIAFSGTLDGQSHAITGLTANRPTGEAGLFGELDGTVSNLTLSGSVTGAAAGLLAAISTGTVTSVSVSGSASTGSGTGPAVGNYVGGLIGLNAGTVTNSHVAVTIAAGNYAYAGGLVGVNAAATSGGVVTSAGTITRSSASGTVNAGNVGATGGLVGYNTTDISASYATGAVTGGTNAHVGGLVGDNQVDSLIGTTGSITTSFATGAVTAGTGVTATGGGLVGFNRGSIADAYATGNVTGGQVSGGLVGVNSGSIANAYATGTVPGTAAPYGGLVGNNAGSISASFWNIATSGTTLGVGIGSASGAAGFATAQMSSLSTFASAGWNIDDTGGTAAIWRIYDGQTAPLLRSFMTALTITGGNGTKVYDGLATSSDVGTLTYAPSSYDSARVLGTASYTASSAHAGSYSGAGLALAGLYSTQLGYDITTVSGSLIVTARPITITAGGQTMTYGDAVPALSYTVGGSGLVGSDTLSGALATAASSTAGVGSYSITQGTLAASSDYAVTYVGANVSVTARPITISADGQTMAYGDAVPSLSYTVGGSGLVNGDALGGALSTTASSTAAVGNYGITLGTLAASSNYTLSYAGATLAITPRGLTVTADDATRQVGRANPVLTYRIGGAGLVNGDALSGSLRTLAGLTDPAGVYAILQGTLAASANYTLSYRAGVLTVTPADIPAPSPTPTPVPLTPSLPVPLLPIFVETNAIDQFAGTLDTRSLVATLGQPAPDQSTTPACAGGAAAGPCYRLPAAPNLPVGPWLSFRSP